MINHKLIKGFRDIWSFYYTCACIFLRTKHHYWNTKVCFCIENTQLYVFSKQRSEMQIYRLYTDVFDQIVYLNDICRSPMLH